jgi:hypothetical protein
MQFVPFLVVAVVLWLASTAYAEGATIRTYEPPPLDAGSAIPNPDYLPTVKPTTGNGFDWGRGNRRRSRAGKLRRGRDRLRWERRYESVFAPAAGGVQVEESQQTSGVVFPQDFVTVVRFAS